MSIADLETQWASGGGIGKVSDLAPVIGYLHKDPTLSPRWLALHPLLPKPLLKASKQDNSSTQDDEFVSTLAWGLPAADRCWWPIQACTWNVRRFTSI
jgi:hypothetical protein